MNEKIKELWNQSRYPSGRGHDEKKFAELIIREAHEIIVVGGVDDVDIVLKHFGIEE